MCVWCVWYVWVCGCVGVITHVCVSACECVCTSERGKQTSNHTGKERDHDELTLAPGAPGNPESPWAPVMP